MWCLWREGGGDGRAGVRLVFINKNQRDDKFSFIILCVFISLVQYLFVNSLLFIYYSWNGKKKWVLLASKRAVASSVDIIQEEK